MVRFSPLGVCFRPSLVSALRKFAAFVSTSFLVSAGAAAQNARFDLTGPKVEVRVTRGGTSLPIASVPNLQPGDRVWLHPDLPTTQSVHYLMVLAFLRGTTNPPPDNWFLRVETWDKKVRQEGVTVTVPDEAQQVVLFLAPVTGGDFTTLRSAVQGRPGIFVRASQDLAAAGFEQARIEKYIASMRQLPSTEAADPKQLQEHSNLIAAALALKPNGDCVKLAPDQQYTCLTQSGSQSLLDDGHGQSIVSALTSGESAGLIGTVSSTQLMGGGLYSAYVGAIVDLVHILGGLHTAHYQYIPAIAFPQDQQMNLRLNTPPSFHDPKSVIVIGLPSVQQSVPPPLRATDPRQVSCLLKPDLVLPVEGAPLVFSTGFAHDLVLHINYPAGEKQEGPQDIPLTPDAFRGGLVLAPPPARHPLPQDSAKSVDSPHLSAKSPSSPPAARSSNGLSGTIRGRWGFDAFTGPTLQLQNEPGKGWKLAENAPDNWLIAGRSHDVQLTASGTACVQAIDLQAASSTAQPELWKATDKPNTIDVSLNVPPRDSGVLHLAIHQFGDSKPASVDLMSYRETAKLDALQYHVGDKNATLTGSGLDQVRQVEFAGITFKPAAQGEANGKPQLLLISTATKESKLTPGNSVPAHVALQDGRTLTVPAAIAAPRPALSLISKADLPTDASAAGIFHVKLGGDNDVPLTDTLTFSIKSAQPFPRTGAIEIASTDGSLHTSLTLSDNASSDKASLILQDPQTLLATIHPLKLFGPSAFGPVHFRPVVPDGTTGDWVPLTTLVRLPNITGLSCSAPAKPAASAPAANPGVQASAKPSDASTVSAVGNPETAKSSDESAAQAVSSQAEPAAAPTPATCTLTGSALYLVDSVAPTQDFANPVHVPEGFVGASVEVPAPKGDVYYLRLRDDPATIDTVTLPAGPLDSH